MHYISRTNIGSNAKALRVVLPMINRLSDLLRDLTTYDNSTMVLNNTLDCHNSEEHFFPT